MERISSGNIPEKNDHFKLLEYGRERRGKKIKDASWRWRGLKEKPSWWFAGGEGWEICLVSERGRGLPGVPCLSHGGKSSFEAKRSEP